MQHLKDQLEQRTRMIEANIQRQQDDLRKIQEQLQMVQGQGLQMFLQQPAGGLNFGSVQLSSGNLPTMQQATSITMQGQVIPSSPIQGGMSTGHISIQQQQQQLLLREQNTTLTQPGSANMVQIASSLPQNTNQSGAVATFTQDRPIGFPQGQQLVTKLVTAPMACGTVMGPRLLHGNQSTQLILSAAFPLQQQSTFTEAYHQQQQQQQQQSQMRLSRHRTDSMSDSSSVQPQ
ncbi:UNVERIFIED_CONTAM: hypothetical protein FKN15_033623 [Acipenser sinensis]